MKNFSTLLKYEIHKLLMSPSTYIIALLFSMTCGLIFFFLLRIYTGFEQDVPLAQMFFRCFLFPTMLIIPLITMRTMAEDYKNGIFHNLFSAPVACGAVVTAKFAAVYLFYVLLWVSSSVLFFSVFHTSRSLFSEVAFAANYNIIGGMIFVCLIGLPLIAIGIFFSACTENQVIASMITFFSLLVIFIGGQFLENISRINNFSTYGAYTEAMNIFAQVDYFCSGIVDTRTIVFYISFCLFILCCASLVAHKKLD